MSLRFQNKNILITGGTSGMGLAGAQRIIREGGKVFLTGRDERRITKIAESLPIGSHAIRNDVASGADQLAQLVEKWGKLEGIWFNAAIAALDCVSQSDHTDFDQMMAINVRGPMVQLAKLLPFLNDGASIVVTSSSSAYEGAATTSGYAATKGAVIAMVRSWATALAERNIRANVIVPGPIDTNFRSFLSEDMRKAFEQSVVQQVPLRRIGTANKAAAVALFLLSDDASYVTGSQYAVDGGLIGY